MSERIEIDYNGRTLTFDERDDEWGCWPLKLKAKSLKTLKAKIDKLDGAARRVSMPAIDLDRYGKASRVDIVLIAKPRDWERRGYSGEAYNQRVPAVWTLAASGNSQERAKVRLDRLCAVTESNVASIKEAERLNKEARALNEQADAVIAAIPRLTLEELTAKGAEEEDLDNV